MMDGWKPVCLGDVVAIKHGFAFSGRNFTERPTGDVLLTPGNFAVRGGFKGDKLKYHRGEVPPDYVLAPGSVLVTMTDLSKKGDTLGYPLRVPDAPGVRFLHNQRLGLVMPFEGAGIDRAFLYYLLCGPTYRNEVLAGATGTTVRHTSPSRIARYSFDLPPIEEQRGIAATLGALDDKIDSNRRAISASLGLSSSLYRSWRLANHDGEPTSFGSFASVFGGATPRTAVDAYWDGRLCWATPTDVTALSEPYLFGTARTISEEGLASCAATVHPAGTILMTSRATIGAFAVNQIPCATNQGFIAVQPRLDHDRWFLFEEMRSRLDEMRDNANGSTFLELSRGIFKTLPLIAPDEAVRANLHRLLDPLHKRAAQLSLESRKLQAIRDALLPELLSGRIRVPEAREAVGG